MPAIAAAIAAALLRRGERARRRRGDPRPPLRPALVPRALGRMIGGCRWPLVRAGGSALGRRRGAWRRLEASTISSATSRIGPKTTLSAKTTASSATPTASTTPISANGRPVRISAPMPPAISAGGGPERFARDAAAAARGGLPRGAGKVGDQPLEVAHGDRGVREPDALLELVVRQAPEQRVLAQEGHHALTLGVGRTELGVRHTASVGGWLARLQDRVDKSPANPTSRLGICTPA